MISLALDRSKYGDKVLSELAGRQDDNSNLNRRQLYDYLRFYKIYPQIVETLSAQFEHLLPLSVSAPSEKVPAVSDLKTGLLTFDKIGLGIERGNHDVEQFNLVRRKGSA